MGDRALATEERPGDLGGCPVTAAGHDNVRVGVGGQRGGGAAVFGEEHVDAAYSRQRRRQPFYARHPKRVEETDLAMMVTTVPRTPQIVALIARTPNRPGRGM